MSDFKRENRYIVFKISDIERYLKSGSMAILDGLAEAIRIERALHDKEPLVCAVIESDWPEYEWVWGAIEARVSGESAAPISVVPRLVPSREDEIGWLIEFRDDHAPRWYEPLCGDSYVAVKALRFARKQDAETLIKALKMQNAFASQHLFVNPPEGNDHGNDDKREPHK